MISKDLVFFRQKYWMWFITEVICYFICECGLNCLMFLSRSAIGAWHCETAVWFYSAVRCVCAGVWSFLCAWHSWCASHWVFPAHRIVINLFAFLADVAGLWPLSLSIDGWSSAGEDTTSRKENRTGHWLLKQECQIKWFMLSLWVKIKKFLCFVK